MLTFKKFLLENINIIPGIKTILYPNLKNKKLKEAVDIESLDKLHRKLSKHYKKHDILKKLSKHSEHINKSLWNHYKHGHEISEQDKNNHHAIDKALYHQTTPESFHTYTGITRHPSEYNNGKKITKKGAVFHHPAYIHTSLDHDLAKSFAYRSNKHTNMHVLKIHVPKNHPGAYIGHNTYHKEENEFVLPKGLNLKIHPNPDIEHEKDDFTGKITKYHTWHTTIEPSDKK